MLKKRVITATILILFLVLVYLFSTPLIFTYIALGIVVLAAIEWTALAGFKTIWGRALAFLSLPFVGLCLFAFLHFLGLDKISKFDTLKFAIAYSVLGFWVLASLAVSIYPKGQWLYQSKIINLIVGLFVLLPTWAAASALFLENPRWLLYPVVLVCLADTAAYFVGKKWGKHALAPAISPGKTWEGVAGALLSTVLVAAVSYYFIFEIKVHFLIWLLFNLITVLFSIVGDLFESIYKRQQNLKDSGNLLPGHGGVLDRIDAMTAALPIFTAGLLMFGF